MNTISYQEAIQTLKAMFPTIEPAVIESVLVSFRGMMEKTIDTLLVMQNETPPPVPENTMVPIPEHILQPSTPAHPPTGNLVHTPQSGPAFTNQSSLDLNDLIGELSNPNPPLHNPQTDIPPPKQPNSDPRPEMTDEEYARLLQQQINEETRKQTEQELRDAQIAQTMQRQDITAAHIQRQREAYLRSMGVFPSQTQPPNVYNSRRGRNPSPQRRTSRQASTPTPESTPNNAPTPETSNSNTSESPGILSKFKILKNRFRARGNYESLDESESDNLDNSSSLSSDTTRNHSQTDNFEDFEDFDPDNITSANDAIPMQNISSTDHSEIQFQLDSEVETQPQPTPTNGSNVSATSSQFTYSPTSRKKHKSANRATHQSPFLLSDLPSNSNSNSNSNPNSTPQNNQPFTVSPNSNSNSNHDSPIVDPFQAIAESLA